MLSAAICLSHDLSPLHALHSMHYRYMEGLWRRRMYDGPLGLQKKYFQEQSDFKSGFLDDQFPCMPDSTAGVGVSGLQHHKDRLRSRTFQWNGDLSDVVNLLILTGNNMRLPQFMFCVEWVFRIAMISNSQSFTVTRFHSPHDTCVQFSTRLNFAIAIRSTNWCEVLARLSAYPEQNEKGRARLRSEINALKMQNVLSSASKQAKQTQATLYLSKLFWQIVQSFTGLEGGVQGFLTQIVDKTVDVR